MHLHIRDTLQADGVNNIGIIAQQPTELISAVGCSATASFDGSELAGVSANFQAGSGDQEQLLLSPSAAATDAELTYGSGTDL